MILLLECQFVFKHSSIITVGQQITWKVFPEIFLVLDNGKKSFNCSNILILQWVLNHPE
jgi:hypothetical protein